MELNAAALELCHAIASEAESLRIAVNETPAGTRIIDCGVDVAGSIEAGRRLAEVCMAGLGDVRVVPADPGIWPGPAVQVTTDQPVLSCMGSQ